MGPKPRKTVTATELLAGSPEKTAWYEVEQNTCALLKAVVARRLPAEMSGEDFWNLMRLTWINAFQREPVENHWRDLKIPALGELFATSLPDLDSIGSAVGAMHLPAAVAQASVQETGMINF